MDYNYSQPQPLKHTNGMETAAFVLGIISIATCACIYVSIVSGALAIMFALLSRGGSMKLSRRSKTALILGIVGMIVSVVTLIVCFKVVIQYYGSLENVLRTYCDMANLDFDTLYGSYFQ